MGYTVGQIDGCKGWVRFWAWIYCTVECRCYSTVDQRGVGRDVMMGGSLGLDLVEGCG